MYRKLLRYSGILITVSLIFTSCAKDEDTTPSGPGSDRDKFLGTWLCSETLQNGPTTVFTIKIESQGSEDTIRISNFNNLGSPYAAIALVSGNSMVIPAQQITQVDIAGSGLFNSQGKILMNYTADTDTLSAVCSQ
jgi:hypothetical protein